MIYSIKLFLILSVGFLLTTLGWLIGEVRAGDDVVFRDDFVGKSLRPEWEISAKDPNRMALIDNEYMLLVTYGPSPKNIMIYKGDLPENYEIILKFQTTPDLRRQIINLGLRENNKNSLWVFYWVGGGGYPKAGFGKRLMGEYSEYEKSVSISKGKPLFLKLSKKGVEYTGQFSLDGSSWTKIGTHVFLNLKSKPEFFVKNEKKGMAETGIRVDYFEIKKTE